MSDPALCLREIEKAYNRGRPNEISVLRGVCLSIAPGEAVALVAPSGAGKSTLLQIAGLLDLADNGRVEIGGRILSGRSDRERTMARRRDVGFVYQFHHLLREFSALENIILPQLANGVPRVQAGKRACELLERAGILARANHRPAALSGGEQQRVAFCRALANKPRILLADEPTGNLDRAASETLFGALIELARETGLSALVATHDTELAAGMDRVVRLEDGRLI